MSEFRFGPLVRCKMTPSGALVPMTLEEIIEQDRENARKPKRETMTVTAIDRDAGTITVGRWK